MKYRIMSLGAIVNFRKQLANLNNFNMVYLNVNNLITFCLYIFKLHVPQQLARITKHLTLIQFIVPK